MTNDEIQAALAAVVNFSELDEVAMTQTTDWLAAGTSISTNDDQHHGTLTGSTYPCTLESCRGVRVSVKWDDGRRSFPCSKGLDIQPDGSLRIV